MSCMNKHANMGVMFKEKQTVAEEKKKKTSTYRNLHSQSSPALMGLKIESRK